MSIANKYFTIPFKSVHEEAVLDVQLSRRYRKGGESTPITFVPVSQFASTVPEKMRLAGGFIVPLHYTESLCIGLNSPTEYPFAIKAISGYDCLLTGRTRTHGLSNGRRFTENGFRLFQNYLATSLNNKIDCRYRGNGEFEPITVETKSIMIDLEIYPLLPQQWKPSKLDSVKADSSSLEEDSSWLRNPDVRVEYAPPPARINVDGYDLAFRQDGRGPHAYDQNTFSRIRLHLVTVMQWENITGQPIEYGPLTK